MIDIQQIDTNELELLLAAIKIELKHRKPPTPTKIITLAYNKYKGKGKCWIARCDPNTKAILTFVNAASHQPRDHYSGESTFAVPLEDGALYLFCQTGSKSTDSRTYHRVEKGELHDN